MALFGDCVEKVVAASAGAMSHDDAEQALKDVFDRAEELKQAGIAAGDPNIQAALDLAEKEQRQARLDRLDALRNAAKRDGIMNQVAANGGLGKAADTLRSIMHGLNTLGRQSIESAWHGLANGWQAALDNQLYKAGLKKAMLSGQMDREVSRAWWAVNAGEDAGKGPAADVARLYAKALDMVRDRLNTAGARIADANDYVTHTVHDPVKMRQAAGPMMSPDEAFAAWWAKTEPRLAEKTFEDVLPEGGESTAEARTRFGRSVYDALVSGVHMVVGSGDPSYAPIAFEGTRNLARKVSQERTLFWRDGEAWHDYMQEFGQFNSLHASVMMSLDRGARQLALMDKMGTNPAANLNLLIRRIEETYRSDLDGLKKFQDQTQNLRNVMGRLDGSLNIPANLGLAQGANAVRQWEAISSLGGVGVTHFASIWPTVSSELVHHGVNRLDALGSMIKALLPGTFSDAATRDVLADLGAFADGVNRHLSSVIGDDSLPGRMNAIASRFMDFTGIHYVFDRTKAGVRAMLAHNLARNLDRDFAALPPYLSDILGKYGIAAEDWAKLRTLTDLPTAEGRAYLTPTAAARVAPELADKLLSYYGDGSAHAVVTAGVRERAFLLGSTRPGTGWGELARFLTQFKMWPVAAMNQVVGREIYMSLSAKNAVWNLGMLVALGIPAGYLRMSVNDLALGHPLRNPADPKTLLAAAAQSGGLGIMGDFLFGETSRMGGGLVSTLAGPVGSDADTLVQIFNRARGDIVEDKHHRAGQFGDIWPDLAHFAVRHIPFANLVYLKGALDYMLWYHLYEAASPGWWERTNRRLLKEQGRTMQGYAPGRPIPWTPWAMGTRQ